MESHVQTVEAIKIVNSRNVREWLDKITGATVSHLCGTTWAARLECNLKKDEQRAFNNIVASINLSFMRRLRGEVVRDVFIHGKTLNAHQEFLDSLRNGRFIPHIIGMASEEAKEEVITVMRELAQVCVAEITTLAAEAHAESPSIKPHIKPIVSTAPAFVVSAANKEKIDGLRAKLTAAIAYASPEELEKLSEKMRGKSVSLKTEIDSLAPDSEMRFLKTQHRAVILDGINQAARRRNVEKEVAARAAAPQRIISDTTPAPIGFQRAAGRIFGAVRSGVTAAFTAIQRHKLAAVTTCGTVAAGALLAMGLGGLLGEVSPVVPQTSKSISAAFHVAATPPAVVSSTVPVVRSHVIQSENEAGAESPKLSAKIALPAKKLVAAYHPFKSAVPAVVAGVTFQRVSTETLQNMCRTGLYQTWACESALK